MWTCPKCKRKFKNINKSHSCGTFSVEQVFEKYPAEIYSLFEIVVNVVKTFGQLNINPVKNGVMISVHSTFLALKPHSTYLALEFAGGIPHDEFPVEKCIRVSKNEYAHMLRIEKPDEIDQQLITWLKEAYLFNCTKT